MNKFTKGPWKVRTDKDDDGDFTLFTYDVYAFPYGEEAGQQGVCYGASNKADMNLISAAPDMYEALKESLDALREIPDWPDLEDDHLLEIKIMDALAKAEGKE